MSATRKFVLWFFQWVGLAIGLAAFWAIVTYGAATWWALPNATTGTQLSTTAWNDIVSQVNGLAGAISISSGKVGIGASNPSAKLEVNGNVKITDGTQGANKVLVSDANGLATWKWNPVTYLSSNSYTVTTAGYYVITSNTIPVGSANVYAPSSTYAPGTNTNSHIYIYVNGAMVASDDSTSVNCLHSASTTRYLNAGDVVSTDTVTDTNWNIQTSLLLVR